MELKRAAELIREICEESKMCKNCPLRIVGQTPLCDVADLSSDEIIILEQKLTQWEKDREVHYPTWEEYWKELFPDGEVSMLCILSVYADFKRYLDCSGRQACDDCQKREIPKDIALKLGIKPKENNNEHYPKS